MALSSCFCHSLTSLKNDHLVPHIKSRPNVRASQRYTYGLKGKSIESSGFSIAFGATTLKNEWSFARGSRIISKPKASMFINHGKGVATVQALWNIPHCFSSFGFPSTKLTSSLFTVGTAAVFPFYTLMLLAPKAKLTKKCMDSVAPFVVFGLLYAYLLYLAWTPDTLNRVFSVISELPSITKMFSSELKLSSQWIHYLAMDLFAARYVFHDGLKNQIETRHSTVMCLLASPVGILIHIITKAITKSARDASQGR